VTKDRTTPAAAAGLPDRTSDGTGPAKATPTAGRTFVAASAADQISWAFLAASLTFSSVVVAATTNEKKEIQAANDRVKKCAAALQFQNQKLLWSAKL
jgi:hypothetical protein